MTPKVSVVIPMLNARAYVADTLDGVFGQTVPAHEVIVVDNGSTDGSPALVRERYPRARVISEPVPGPSAARNAGVAAASGDLLAFCDSDDVWLPWKLERQLGLLAKIKAQGRGLSGRGDVPGSTRP
jgi:glycosyltransferase involved in cell wall biosynthesis